MKGNCRRDNKCVFCKYWIGEEANVNYATGSSSYTKVEGLCKKNKRKCRAGDICCEFERCLRYA